MVDNNNGTRSRKKNTHNAVACKVCAQTGHHLISLLFLTLNPTQTKKCPWQHVMHETRSIEAPATDSDVALQWMPLRYMTG